MGRIYVASFVLVLVAAACLATGLFVTDPGGALVAAAVVSLGALLLLWAGVTRGARGIRPAGG